MEAVSIYKYENPRQFLLDCIEDLKRSQPGLTIRTLASRMGISHTLLVMLLQGKRGLRVKHASSIAKGLQLSSQERLYLQALLQFDSAEDTEERQLCSLWLAELHPERGFQTRALEEFAVISHWIHMAIFAMTDLKAAPSTPEELYSYLRKRATIHEVRAALERMIALKLVERTPTGKLRSCYQSLTTPDDIANEGAIKYHKGVMALAQESLDTLPLEQREFQAFAMAVDRKKIPLAKELIRKFKNSFVKAVASESGDEVYQMNLQFFQLTESPENAVKSCALEDEGVDGRYIQSVYKKGKSK